jgi:hypothetical protein
MIASTFFTAHLVDVKVVLTLRFDHTTGQGRPARKSGTNLPGDRTAGLPGGRAGRPDRRRGAGLARGWHGGGRGKLVTPDQAATSGP